MYAFRVTGTTGTGEPTLFDDGAGKMAAQFGAAAGVKGCHCEEPLGDVAIRIPKMFPFWLQCVQNRKVLGNGLPEGELPEGQEKPPWGAGLRPSQ